MGVTKYVQLITTGSLEQRALAESLSEFFGSALLQCEHTIEFLPTLYVDGFTSHRVNPELISGTQLPSTTAYRLVRALIAALVPRKRRDTKPDLVIAIDDVEVPNLGNLNAIAELVRRCAEHFVSHHDHVDAQRVLKRCSFHLVSPMIESYFFVEPERVLGLATQGGARPARGVREQDLEHFDASADEGFMDPELETYGPTEFRRHHPKRYIQHLSAPGFTYRETHEGVAALRAVEWEQVVWWSPDHDNENHIPMACVRALLEDITELLEGRPFWEDGEAATSRSTGCTVLRNL